MIKSHFEKHFRVQNAEGLLKRSTELLSSYEDSYESSQESPNSQSSPFMGRKVDSFFSKRETKETSPSISLTPPSKSKLDRFKFKRGESSSQEEKEEMEPASKRLKSEDNPERNPLSLTCIIPSCPEPEIQLKSSSEIDNMLDEIYKKNNEKKITKKKNVESTKKDEIQVKNTKHSPVKEEEDRIRIMTDQQWKDQGNSQCEDPISVLNLDFSMEKMENKWNEICLEACQSKKRSEYISSWDSCNLLKEGKEAEKLAEKELEKTFHKDFFEKMKIVGQFNNAFIIARLENDLFIIDQHASDEKFNFERLQKDHVVQKQKVLVPSCMDFTAEESSIVKDHSHVFNKNGFEFEEEEGELFLSAFPFSKTTSFGKRDIFEMINLLREDPNLPCRPSKIVSMFASRACRSSVMFGDALNKEQMGKVLLHMGKMDHPWNCPHGRPTMRHLHQIPEE